MILTKQGRKDKKVPRGNLTRSFCLYLSSLCSLHHLVIVLIVFRRSICRLFSVIITPRTNDILLILLLLGLTGPVGGPGQCLHSEHNTTPVSQLHRVTTSFPWERATIPRLPLHTILNIQLQLIPATFIADLLKSDPKTAAQY